MWHKPCRTFHPWCPCIKTRCLGASRCTPKAHLGYPLSAPNTPRCTHAPKAHLHLRSKCAPKAHQMDLNKIVLTNCAPIWLSHIHSAPNTHLKNFTFFYNAPGAHQMDLNKIVRTKSAPIWLCHFHSTPNPHQKKLTFFYNAPEAHQMELNKLCAPKAQLFNLVIFTMHLICNKWTWNFAKSQVTFDFPITDTFWDMNQSKFKLWLIHIEKGISDRKIISNLTFFFLRLYSLHPYKRSDR